MESAALAPILLELIQDGHPWHVRFEQGKPVSGQDVVGMLQTALSEKHINVTLSQIHQALRLLERNFLIRKFRASREDCRLVFICRLGDSYLLKRLKFATPQPRTNHEISFKHHASLAMMLTEEWKLLHCSSNAQSPSRLIAGAFDLPQGQARYHVELLQAVGVLNIRGRGPCVSYRVVVPPDLVTGPMLAQARRKVSARATVYLLSIRDSAQSKSSEERLAAQARRNTWAHELLWEASVGGISRMSARSVLRDAGFTKHQADMAIRYLAAQAIYKGRRHRSREILGGYWISRP